MRTRKNVPLFYTFTNWLITVVLGSALLPIVASAFGENNELTNKTYFDDDTAGIIVISMIASAVCSLPALVVLFITHLLLNRSEQNMNNHQAIQNVVHIAVSVLTFLVFAINMGMGARDAKFLYAIAFTYAPVGLIVWNFTYLLRRRKAVNPVGSNDEVLDEL